MRRLVVAGRPESYKPFGIVLEQSGQLWVAICLRPIVS